MKEEKKKRNEKKSERERKKNFDPEAEPYPSCTPESPGGDRFNDVKLFFLGSTSFFTPHIKKKEICFGTTSHQGSSSSEGSQF